MNLESTRKLNILVSHSGKQYVHQLLKGLLIANHKVRFFTSFAYKSQSFPFTLTKILPGKFRVKIEKELIKRKFEGIPDNSIFQNPWFEIIREISDKLFSGKYSEQMLFRRDRLHDIWAAKKLRSEKKIDIVIGYEECCLETFREAKKNGITTILDLAQIHYKEIIEISNQFRVFSEIYRNQELRKKINLIKEEELLLADYIICLSKFAKESLIKNGIPENKIFIANLGFDPYKFRPKQLYNTSSSLKVVYAGTLTKRKGIDLLLKLKDDLKEKIELTFIGPMSDAKDLFEEYKEPYTVYEYLEQSEMNTVFQKSDVFVFPSYLDSWAMVVIEAMGCGLPVIVTENTGSKDAISIENDSGYIIKPGDFSLLKEAVMSFYADKSKIKSMGEKALKVASLFSWNNYYNQLDKIIYSINQKKESKGAIG